MDLIVKDIKEQNGIVFARIDQKQAAEEAGLIGQLDDTEFILFGNPKKPTGVGNTVQSKFEERCATKDD
ncbi:unnamed protein product [Rotaria magnacalcarata]|uniref:Uncharacterized protein n=1 Tax=Rotaria magnacalcarata TaxID=392030 RepID=A0A8S2J8P7_9BILA|nr:unnamed protein product [Rotaria magnacalcarata]CAF3802634.1 unnamed protein product [Rotaria magnacalcarata]CAF3828521.1 unnamed protein product [Rotaria magnacalcarata]